LIDGWDFHCQLQPVTGLDAAGYPRNMGQKWDLWSPKTMGALNQLFAGIYLGYDKIIWLGKKWYTSHGILGCPLLRQRLASVQKDVSRDGSNEQRDGVDHDKLDIFFTI
jgi:hypothetical protein